MIGLQRTTRAMLRVHGCACSSSHAAHSERPVDMRMSCRDEDVDKCDGVDLLCATRSRSNLQAVATGKRLKYRVQTFGCGLTCRTKGPEMRSARIKEVCLSKNNASVSQTIEAPPRLNLLRRAAMERVDYNLYSGTPEPECREPIGSGTIPHKNRQVKVWKPE